MVIGHASMRGHSADGYTRTGERAGRMISWFDPDEVSGRAVIDAARHAVAALPDPAPALIAEPCGCRIHGACELCIEALRAGQREAA